jgi:hypothetical protein
VQAVHPPLPWRSLFDGLPEERAADLAPLLLRIDLHQPMHHHWLRGLLGELAGKPQVLVLVSTWPFDALAGYLSRCLEAENGGRVGLLRYYDPRLFRCCSATCWSPSSSANLLRPAVFWSWCDHDGLPRRRLGLGEPVSASDDFLRIALSDAQLDTLLCAADATVALDDLQARQGRALRRGMLPARLRRHARRQPRRADRRRRAPGPGAPAPGPGLNPFADPVEDTDVMPHLALPRATLALMVLLSAGCATAPAPAQAGSGSIDAINHTHWAINHFSVDGRNAVDIIGPYQGGGGACCFAVPAQWKPGMTVRVDWETGEAYPDGFPGFADGQVRRVGRENQSAETPAQQSRAGAGLQRPGNLRHHRAFPALRPAQGHYLLPDLRQPQLPDQVAAEAAGARLMPEVKSLAKVAFPPQFPVQGRLPDQAHLVACNIDQQQSLENAYRNSLCLAAGRRVVPPCCKTLHISLFFDGTGNNLYNDQLIANVKHPTNIARLFRASIGAGYAGGTSLSPGADRLLDEDGVGTGEYYKYYMPGVGTPFPKWATWTTAPSAWPWPAMARSASTGAADADRRAQTRPPAEQAHARGGRGQGHGHTGGRWRHRQPSP